MSLLRIRQPSAQSRWLRFVGLWSLWGLLFAQAVLSSSFVSSSKYARGGSLSKRATQHSTTAGHESGVEELEVPTDSISDMLSDSKSSLKDEGPVIRKRGGSLELLDESKLLEHLKKLCRGLDLRYVHPQEVTTKTIRGVYPNITTAELNTLASETAASLSTQHPDYARLAARICITAAHKTTNPSFTETMLKLHEDGKGFISKAVADIVHRRGKEIDEKIQDDRDLAMSYFGYKTLERSYLLKDKVSGEVMERPQYMFMRVALGIHCRESDDNEEANLVAAFETYDFMSQGYFMHASPTLFHAGTTHPQLSSCFLLQMSDDSIHGIYETLTRCAKISKAAGGIGLCVHNIRARGTYIKGTRGVSNGLVPMLRVFDVTSRYVDQGGGKRPGAFAVYIEPWHADIFDVLNLKKNHGKEEQRARDLFYGLWIPDLFMKRVEEDGTWSLMCPDQCRGLQYCHGEEFEKLYTQYEKEGKAVRTVRARELWGAILDAQIETGTPYMLYKDACNAKSNQQNLGTIQCSNLCTEIVQYTDSEQIAVCNLASM
jgi:ribonucleotide reductase alpha subunit